MDSKLTQKFEIPIILRSTTRVLLQSPLPHLRFCLVSLENKKKLLAKRFQGLAEIDICIPSSWVQRWNFHVQEQFKGQNSNHFLVHVVKEGETLTSISREYGVSVQSIAEVNEKLVDVDLVLIGQKLNIPSSSTKDVKKNTMWKNWSDRIDAQKRWQRSLNIFGGSENYKSFTMLSSSHLLPLPAKTTGYFLLLVPLIAFCIRCIISAFHHRVVEDLKRRVVNESESHQRGSRSIRWRSALSDLREPDDLSAEPKQDSSKAPEDQPPVPFEEMSHAYTELEPAYQKFLSDCGMSEWGYWRGGSSK